MEGSILNNKEEMDGRTDGLRNGWMDRRSDRLDKLDRQIRQTERQIVP